MKADRMLRYSARAFAAWIVVGALSGSEHHGTVKSGGLPLPGGRAEPFTLKHALEAKGFLLCRYVREGAG